MIKIALEKLTYLQILGKPLIMWLGIATLIAIIITATIGFYLRKGRFNYKTHMKWAIISLILAFMHGMLGLASYF